MKKKRKALKNGFPKFGYPALPFNMLIEKWYNILGWDLTTNPPYNKLIKVIKQ